MKIARLVFLSIFLSSFASADDASAPSPVSPRRGTNFSVSTDDLEPFDLNKETDPDDKKPVFYSDENVMVGFNEDSEPSVGMRF